MSIKIKNLTVKNFLSVGNVTQAIDFDRNDLTLVLGENLDLGGDDAGARNGTGKTTIVNALSYGLYGQAVSNIKKDNLINRTNNKNMLVTLSFDCDGIHYHIERGRRPNILKFFVNDVEKESDDNSQGDSRLTQQDIVKTLGMTHDMFRHVIALNTYTEPFLALRAADQRSIIEQLLGITLLSEKADALKEQVRTTKEAILQEEYTIKANQEANQRVQEQIENLRRRQRIWVAKHKEDIDKLKLSINTLTEVEIDKEIDLHKLWEEYKIELDAVERITNEAKTLASEITKTERSIAKHNTEIKSLEEHKCYACGQKLHDKKQTNITKSKKSDLAKEDTYLVELSEKLTGVEIKLSGIKFTDSPDKPFYKTIEEAYNHKNSLEHITNQLEDKLKEHDPYTDQIDEMTNKAVVEIEYATMETFVKLREHQEFLLKLLTNKDSFIRKKIIDQNLSYLNSRLGFYLDKIGLPHSVVFLNDLSTDIQELGRDLDFDNLSRGERNRLILSLSWAFRDVWESLYKPVNLLFIDELIDSGMDGSGVESSLAILKRMGRDLHKSIWLISHKDELISRVNNVLHVIKENGFTSYSNYVDVET